MNRSELVKYLEDLRKEEAEKHSREGVTAWAVLGAMVALTFSALPQFQRLEASKSAYLLLSLAYAHIHTALVIGSLLFGPMLIRPKRPNDYRFPTPFTAGSLRATFVSVLLKFLFPACASLFGLQVLGLPPAQRFTLWANVWIFGFLSLAFMAVNTAILVQSIRKTHLSPKFLVIAHGIREKVGIYSTIAILVSLFVANVACFGRGLLIHQWPLADFPSIALSISLLSFALVLFISIRGGTHNEVVLWRLQRDFILYEMTDVEVRTRLEEEYLGQQLGDWVLARLREVRQKATDLEGKAATVAEVVSSLNDPELEWKIRSEKTTQFLNELRDQFNQYGDEIDRLVNWLTSAARLNDPYVAKLIRDSSSDLRESLRSTRAIVDDAMTQLSSAMVSQRM